MAWSFKLWKPYLWPAGMSSSAYASAQGASDVTMDMFTKAETETPGMNYGMVQSAATSSEFVSRCLVRQKKKFRKWIFFKILWYDVCVKCTDFMIPSVLIALVICCYFPTASSEKFSASLPSFGLRNCSLWVWSWVASIPGHTPSARHSCCARYREYLNKETVETRYIATCSVHMPYS